MAHEKHLSGSDTPCTGLALSQAVQTAIEKIKKPTIFEAVFSDLNGEPYRADQYGFTLSRFSRNLSTSWKQITPALVTGDVGAATFIIHCALASYRLAKNKEPSTSLVLSSSDDSLRAAAIITNNR